jgi:hypothetical protein
LLFTTKWKYAAPLASMMRIMTNVWAIRKGPRHTLEVVFIFPSTVSLTKGCKMNDDDTYQRGP